ncbi:MAG: hypothetical protein U0T73_08825 [Chitinophagales bacterium]
MGKRSFILGIATLMIVLVSSCKKETAVSDDPNIVYKSLNRSWDVPAGTISKDSLDLNNDGQIDLGAAIEYDGGDTGAVVLVGLHQSMEFATASLMPFPYPILYKSGELTPITTASYSDYSYVGIKTHGYRIGLQGGDTYVVFRFTTGTKYQYGWMKLNVNNSFSKLTLVEYGYSLIPETAISVGAK